TERILEFTLPIIRRKIMYRFVTVAVLLAAPTAFAQDLSKEEKADGFVKIFNGKDLTGWTGATERFAVDDDGTLFCKKTKNIENLLTKQEYGDFILRLDYLTTGGCNNGVGLRMRLEPGQRIAPLEIQIVDDDHYKKKVKAEEKNGSLYGHVAAEQGW